MGITHVPFSHFLLSLAAAAVLISNLQVGKHGTPVVVAKGVVSQLTIDKSDLGDANERKVWFYAAGACVHGSGGSAGDPDRELCHVMAYAKCGAALDSAKACWIPNSEMKEAKCADLKYATSTTGDTVINIGTAPVTTYGTAAITLAGNNLNKACVLAGCDKAKPATVAAAAACADLATGATDVSTAVVDPDAVLQKGFVYKDKYVLNILQAKSVTDTKGTRTTAKQHRENTRDLAEWYYRVTNHWDTWTLNVAASSLLVVHCLLVVQVKVPWYTSGKYTDDPKEGPKIFGGFDPATVADGLFFIVWIFFFIDALKYTYRSGFAHWTGSISQDNYMLAIGFPGVSIVIFQFFVVVNTVLYCMHIMNGGLGYKATPKHKRAGVEFDTGTAKIVMLDHPSASDRASMVRNNLNV